MSIDKKRLDIITDFFHKLTFGIERKYYNGIEIGANIFILYFIGRMKECIMSEITRYLNINASTATRRVDKLVKLELLERFTIENDRRQIKVRLTKKGTQIYSEILKRRISRFETLKSEFSEQELGAFFKIIEYLNNMDPSDNIAQM
jgi:DNA-binding MarR family transcriptional regulator